MRRRATPAEAVLWQRLRRDQLDGLHFRRQHPIGRFVLDFYCPAARLVVELGWWRAHEANGTRRGTH